MDHRNGRSSQYVPKMKIEYIYIYYVYIYIYIYVYIRKGPQNRGLPWRPRVTAPCELELEGVRAEESRSARLAGGLGDLQSKLKTSTGLLWGIVASYFQLLGCPGGP